MTWNRNIFGIVCWSKLLVSDQIDKTSDSFQVVSQVHQLLICRDWPEATTVRDGPVTQLTPQQLSTRLTSVAEGYQGEEGRDTDRINMGDNHSQGLNYESKRGDCQKRKRERCFYASKSANSSTYSSQATLDTSDHSPFIPIRLFNVMYINLIIFWYR